MRSWTHIILPGLVTCLVLLSPTAQGNDEATTAGTLPVFSYTVPTSEPVIEYSLKHHMLAEYDPVPLLRVYGDGRLLVHRPAYMKNAGDFVLQLQQDELEQLLRTHADKGVMDFDSAATKQEHHQLRAARRATTGQLFHVSDATDTNIRIRLDGFQRTAASKRMTGLDKQITWRNLEMDARNFPSSARLQDTAAAAAVLHNLINHPELVRQP